VYEAVDDARIDCWDREAAPLILTESRSLAGVLTSIAAEYLCPIAATNGQVGGFLHTDVIPALVEKHVVLYFGDADLSGDQIEGNTRREIEAETGPLNWFRMAITAAQVEVLRDRGVAPIVKHDRRYNDSRRHEAYETEALGQGVIQTILRDVLDRALPEPLEAVRVREQAEQDEVREQLGVQE
jgi:hypothetical protein